MASKCGEKYQLAPTTDVITKEQQVPGLSAHHGEDTHSDNGSNLSAGATWAATEHVTSIAYILDALDEVQVHQRLDFVEACMCCERPNRWSLRNKSGEQILYTYEGAQCLLRSCYGSLREFTLVTTDNEDNRLLYIQRPVRCSTRCCYCCFCLQKLTVFTPPHDAFGHVVEKWSCCIPQYELSYPDGISKFRIVGECCHCRLCSSINFSVQNTSGSCVARISKEWGKCSPSACVGASNQFNITYLQDISKEDKVLILSSSFLLDFNYFGKHGKCY